MDLLHIVGEKSFLRFHILYIHIHIPFVLFISHVLYVDVVTKLYWCSCNYI